MSADRQEVSGFFRRLSDKLKILGKKTGAAFLALAHKAAAVVKDVVNIYFGNDIRVYAGFATLKITTAIFPLFMMIIAILNFIPAYSPEDFTEMIFSMLPDLPEIKSLFMNVMSNLQRQSSGLLASVAALTTLWSASSGVSSVQRGLRKIYTETDNGVVRGKALAIVFTLVLVVMVPVLLLLNILGSSVSGVIRDALYAFGLENLTESLAQIVRVSGIFTYIMAFLTVLLLYVGLPGGRHRKLKSQLPGAFFTLVGRYLMNRIFSFFIPLFWKSSIYGSLASFFLTILWLQVAINILFLGSALNKSLQLQKQKI